MWDLDHLAVTCADLGHGVAYVEAALGVHLQPGGQHVKYATHNALLGLEDGLYLEVIAADPGQAAPAVRWFGLDHFAGKPRLGNWICRVDDLAEALALSPQGGGVPVAMARGDLRWQIEVPDDGTLPLMGGWPTLMTWGSGTQHPATRLIQHGVRLTRMTVFHPQADWIADMIAPQLRDDRIVFEAASAPGFAAAFSTPHGERTLS